jgi:hypothetical protein
MTYRVASGPAGTALGPTEPHPHLVCSWTLDPASHRLSCAWAPPAAGWDVTFLSPRTAATGSSARLAWAKPQA